jgi:two-component system, OmpR family, response regulator
MTAVSVGTGVQVGSLTGTQRILLIDDEPRILNFTSRGLVAEGFSVEICADGHEGLRRAVEEHYDLVVLDLLMPGIDGIEVLRRLVQAKPRQAVIVLSALTDPSSKVHTLELGAVDYVPKPFSFEELLARIRVRLREAARSSPTLVIAGRLTLDLVRREATVGGRTVLLTEREFLLLKELIRSAGQPVSKGRLLSNVWGYHFDPCSNVVDVYVGRLRAKLGADVIETVRGEGYRVDGV